MRFELVINRMLEDIKEYGCQLRLAPLVDILNLHLALYNRQIDSGVEEHTIIAYAAGRMYDYFGPDTLKKYMDLYYTPNRLPNDNAAEILSRSHTHPD